MSRDTGLSPSYLNYLEHGRFGDVGIEKFARLVQAMQVSADQVLAEAGYLPKRSKDKPVDPHSYLRDRYKLSPANLELATKFLEFLARSQRRGLQAEKEPRRK
jgi:transcriptional regulator with XRE-family HTH domain